MSSIEVQEKECRLCSKLLIWHPDSKRSIKDLVPGGHTQG
jgi:hypothetical protein